MPITARPLLRAARTLAAGAGLIGGLVLSGAPAAIAQSNCSQVASQLRAIESSDQFRQLDAAQSRLSRVQSAVSQAEREFVNSGCQQELNQTGTLSSRCRPLARTITSGRDDLGDLEQMVRDGQSLAGQRQNLMQQYARLNCAAQPETGDSPRRRRSLLEQIFGQDPDFRRDGSDYIDRPVDPWSNMSTLRTVCVRTCDGYYWPVSFSTVERYLPQDAQQCASQCPGTETRLFSYRNPGEDPEDMIATNGERYASMPYAFRYRKDYDSSCTCRSQISRRASAASGVPAQSQPVIDFTREVPLPKRDPRGIARNQTVAEAEYVPLPRPRPNEDGDVAAAQAASQPEDRTYQMGKKTVRVVGPETPYVPEEEEAP